MSQLILFNKPFRVLSQFRSNDERPTLAHFFSDPTLRIAGRLDFDSEGLLLLTDSGPLAHRITAPAFKLPKTYWVQVEGAPDRAALSKLVAGVELNDGPARAHAARLIDAPPLWPRNPPVRQRQTVADHWLEIQLTEGRNRQVRRMTAAVGLPTLRLVRAHIGDWSLQSLQPGEHRALQVHAPAPPPRPQRRRQPRRGRKA